MHHCCQMWAHALEHTEYVSQCAKEPALQKRLWGDTLFCSYCVSIWYFCIFVSLCVCVCIVRESLLKEFTSGENVYFSTLAAKLSVLMIQEVMCFPVLCSLNLVTLNSSFKFLSALPIKLWTSPARLQRVIF